MLSAIFMSLAIGSGVYLLTLDKTPSRQTLIDKFTVGLCGILGATLGAKLPFALWDWPGLLDGTTWFSNGKTIMLGLVGGYFGVEFAKWMLEIKEKTGDRYAVPVAVSVSIGRLSCFFGGCCYGTPTDLPWGVIFHDGILRHPTQIYESIFHATMAILLAIFRHYGWFRLQLFKIYLLCYFVYRFISEFIRPEPKVFLSLTAYQWACVFFTLLFLYLYWHDEQLKNGSLSSAKREALSS
ncbi:Phosphatidylglycerol--prolipoprotein diacylglyceryl transferase [Planctomycetales bacterium 10988]|nr:Phosphatidylglycerol--prolipoprotein diacylglyceryl transferase [Planctomycetales bacterium 10988]